MKRPFAWLKNTGVSCMVMVMSAKPSRVLVVPSNRPDRLKDFVQTWSGGLGGWDHSILIEDAPTRSDLAGYFDQHVSHEQIKDDLKEASWIISKKDSACRCYGFLLAWRMGAEAVLTLDDDCYPANSDQSFNGSLFSRHIMNMMSHSRWVDSIPGVRTRGMPYVQAGCMKPTVMNMGLWTENADYDAVQHLSMIDTGLHSFTPPRGNQLIPNGQYVNICGMNLMIERKALPLAYFPLMGEGYPYRRFDDIWMGIIAKKVCDHLGWSISVGEPFVRHIRASDPFVNLVKEGPGLARNETFWQDIDAIPLAGSDALTCMEEIASGLCKSGDEYLVQLSKAIMMWVQLFGEAA